MATRCLTDVFVLMRNNAALSRHMYSEQLSERASLMSPDGETGVHLLRSGNAAEMYSDDNEPPAWLDNLEEARYALSRIQGKLQELNGLHTKHLLRPTMQDSSHEETEIKALSQEIAKMFASTHKQIQHIRRTSLAEARHNKEKRLSYNVVSSLVTNLQNLSNKLRESQHEYVNKLGMREQRSKNYLMLQEELDQAESFSAEDVLFSLPPGTNAMNSQQMLVFADNKAMIEEREAEVRKIVSSIVDLNTLFKDLAHMVVEQGTVLDRIDYNVEQTSEQVMQGLKQLQKAQKFQRGNRKMKCIMCMSITILVLLFLLIFFKT